MITTEKDFAKAVRRIGEIGDLLPRIATKVEGILFDTPSDPLEFKDYKMLVSLGKELCELSTSIPSPGQRLICENGMINTEAENANRDDLESITDVHAQEIDAMSEDEIDASVPDSSVKRAEELVRVKPNTGDMLLDIIKAHTEIAKVAYQAGRESK